MITRVKVRNFKRFDEVDLELGRVTLLIGPNNLGKTTALQALSLWDVGMRRWREKRSGDKAPEKRPGVTINRKDLTSIPLPVARLLWKDLHVRESYKEQGKTKTKNIRIEVIVSGVADEGEWECGLEFDYANEESLYCRPIRDGKAGKTANNLIPEAAAKTKFAYLPPMSGLAANERVLMPGAIDVLVGEGRTAEVLRNLCYRIYADHGDEAWAELANEMERLFGMELDPPQLLPERGEVTMSYREKGIKLDLSSAGRGAQQTMLLLAWLYDNPGSALLLDEPDAHLELLRQSQIYEVLTKAAETRGAQIIAASHSERLLNEAAKRDVVIAFLGRPHRIDDRGSQILKSLKDINFDQYYQAEQTGWVLYLEGPTDLAILRAFAEKLDHEAKTCLERPFVHYMGTNQPQRAKDHFFGLREAKPDLAGIAIFDRLDKDLQDKPGLIELMWQKREIENYLSQKETLIEFARRGFPETPGPLFESFERENRIKAMQEAIKEITAALQTLNKPLPFSSDIKASDDFLEPLFKSFYKKLGLPNLMKKSNYHQLARFVPVELIDDEVREKLDAIVKVATLAKPAV